MLDQIKTVVNSINFYKVNGKISLELTSGQDTLLGKIVADIYYTTKITELAGDLITGYPHNGGEHTMRIHGVFNEVLALLELISEEMGDRYRKLRDQCNPDSAQYHYNNKLTELCSELTFVAQECYLTRKK